LLFVQWDFFFIFDGAADLVVGVATAVDELGEVLAGCRSMNPPARVIAHMALNSG
jgi:hypothetical protein